MMVRVLFVSEPCKKAIGLHTSLISPKSVLGLKFKLQASSGRLNEPFFANNIYIYLSMYLMFRKELLGPTRCRHCLTRYNVLFIENVAKFFFLHGKTSLSICVS